MPTHPVYRAARAVVFATVCTALAITGHAMASHASVPTVAAAGGLAAMIVVGIALGGTERSLATLAGLLLGGQFVLHAMFAAGQYGQSLGHGGGMAPSSDGTAMTVAHVGAAALSAWWLRRGERAVWDLARRIAAALLGPALALLSVFPSPDAPARRRRVPAGAARPRPALLRHVVVRRGPPSPRAALA